MRKDQALLSLQRKNLDERLTPLQSFRRIPAPKSGWLKAVRTALGMSASDLARRLEISQSGVSILEKRELEKTCTLESLEKAAHAMNCEIVYAIVPRESLEKTVSDQAHEAARALLLRAQHSMSLENQPTSQSMNSHQLEELADELKRSLDRRLWNPK